MKDDCVDIFKEYDLPFETYFLKCIKHDVQSHNQIELIWLIKGKATITCCGENYDLTDQNVFLIYMNQEHIIKSTEGSIIISYRFKTEHYAMNMLHFERIPFKHRVYSFKELSDKYHEVPLLITQILKLLISPAPSEITRYKIIGYYNLFIYELYNFLLKEKYLDVKNKNYDQYLIRLHLLIDYISEHLHEKISLDTLATVANISKYRLSHFFSESLGISFSEFLQNTRLESAIKKLRDTELPIQEVASASGFSDVKYLNKMLKARFKMTALKYRKWIKHYKKQSESKNHVTDFINELNTCLNDIEKDHKFCDTYGLLQNMIKKTPI